MNRNEDAYRLLAQCFLPSEMVDSFDIVNVHISKKDIDIYLDEKMLVPEGYSRDELQPNGFTETTHIQDFPMRDKHVTLHVRRRRWLKLPENKNVVKDWQLVAEGTRLSKDFAAFLKGLLGQ
jgi:hypothetical protein